MSKSLIPTKGNVVVKYNPPPSKVGNLFVSDGFCHDKTNICEATVHEIPQETARRALSYRVGSTVIVHKLGAHAIGFEGDILHIVDDSAIVAIVK